jgi:alkylresorcinol/alkylpyrone synthase
MFVNGLGTAKPPQRYTKRDCWEAFKVSKYFAELDRRARAIAETVLLSENGIESRYLATSSLGEAFQIDPDTLHTRFTKHAPQLGTQAAEQALAQAKIKPEDVDAIVASTCTGYLCPGLTSYLAENLGMRSNVLALDLVGQGCVAALPNWTTAEALIAAGRCGHVLSVCVEVSSAAMYLDNDPGVLISACLFGDGAGAAVLSGQPNSNGRRMEWKTSSSVLNPAERDALRFETRGGMLRNILTQPVPRLAAEHAQIVLNDVLRNAGLIQSEISAWIWHAGGRDVLLALQDRMGLKAEDVRHSSAILREYGNLSSAFVYFVLQAALADSVPDGYWWLSSFGAGFSCHGALLEVAS